MDYKNMTEDELTHELKLQEALRLAEEKSDRKYAIKLVEVIVFTGVGFILLGVLGALIALVVR